jgi:TPR repeat protein
MDDMIKLAEDGCSNAQQHLGSLYYNNKEYKNAFKWTYKSALQGNYRAQNNLGVLYTNGIGVKTNYKDAFTWFSLSANQGSEQAQYFLGIFYKEGRYIKKNNAMAVKWLNKSSKQGNENAQIVLNKMMKEYTFTLEEGLRMKHEIFVLRSEKVLSMFLPNVLVNIVSSF